MGKWSQFYIGLVGRFRFGCTKKNHPWMKKLCTLHSHQLFGRWREWESYLLGKIYLYPCSWHLHGLCLVFFCNSISALIAACLRHQLGGVVVELDEPQDRFWFRVQWFTSQFWASLRGVKLNFFGGAFHTDVDVFDDSRFNKNVNWDSFGYVTKVSLG